MSLTDLSLAIGTPYGCRFSTREITRTRFSNFVIILFIFFYSKRPRAMQERVKSLFFDLQVSGVHRHQAIVILTYNISSENLCRLHGTTMSNAIFYHVPRPLCPQQPHTQSIAHILNLLCSIVYLGGCPPINQSKTGETSEMKREIGMAKLKNQSGCIPQPYNWYESWGYATACFIICHPYLPLHFIFILAGTLHTHINREKARGPKGVSSALHIVRVFKRYIRTVFLFSTPISHTLHIAALSTHKRRHKFHKGKRKAYCYLLLTLGAHAQRGLRYLLCLSVCVCVCLLPL